MTTMAQGYQTYRSVQTYTSDRVQLVVMLYEAAIRFLHQADAAIDAHVVDTAHNGIVRAEQILEELQMALDRRQGPVAEQLHSLYTFMLRELENANSTKDRQRVQGVCSLLEELLSAWRAVSRQPGSPGPLRAGDGERGA